MAKAQGPSYRVFFRRRREKRTNYAKRFALLKGRKTRLIARKSNKYFYVQFAEFNERGDKIIASTSSRELVEYGFKGKCNTPSAYLTALLCGKKALSRGVKEFVLDTGLHPATKGGIVFAALKGAVDAGLATGFTESTKEMLPSEERIAGKHLSEEAQKQFVEAKQRILESRQEKQQALQEKQKQEGLESG